MCKRLVTLAMKNSEKNECNNNSIIVTTHLEINCFALPYGCFSCLVIVWLIRITSFEFQQGHVFKEYISRFFK
jgi:hypothetical protein